MKTAVALILLTFIGLGLYTYNEALDLVEYTTEQPTLEPVKSPAYGDTLTQDNIANAVNAYRFSEHRPMLGPSPVLNTMAQARAESLCKLNQWSHDGYVQMFDASPYKDYTQAGENLSNGYITTTDTMVGWVDSPEHKKNMLLEDYRDIGAGVTVCPKYQGREYVPIVVTLFGAR